jgi:flagellar hook-length control protein FliK
VSPEGLLSVGAAAANAPAVSSSPGPALSGGGAAGAGNSGSGDTSGASSGSSAANPQQGAQAPNAQQSDPAQNSGPGKSASTQPRARDGSQTRHGTPAGKNFSQALAQSLAAPAKSPAAALTGKPSKPAAHPGVKAHKPDPVSAAMALMGQAVPNTTVAAQSGAAGKTSASAAAQAGGASRIDAASLAAESAAHKLTQTKALTQISGADAHSAQASVGQSSSNAQLVSAGQLAAGVHSAARPAAAPPSATLSAPVGSSGWNEQLGTQLTWMVSKGVQNASLQMAPQHLGPVQVSISVHHGQASVWFGAAQAETRQALSQALPQLRAMFASQGLALTDSGVSQNAPRDSRRAARPAVNGVGEVGAADGTAAAVSGGLAGTGLIDTYA